LNDEPVARRELEHGSDALAGVGVGHGGLLEIRIRPRRYVRTLPTAIRSAADVIANHGARTIAMSPVRARVCLERVRDHD
jgi:hypothetical protein